MLRSYFSLVVRLMTVVDRPWSYPGLDRLMVKKEKKKKTCVVADVEVCDVNSVAVS